MIKQIAYRGLLMFALIGLSAPSWAVDVRFSGFGDIIIGSNWGGPADANDALLYEQFGTDEVPLSSHDGVTLTGVDFVTIVDLTEDWTFLTEVNLQTVRGGSSEIEVDVERIFINYDMDRRLNIQAGLYFTPIGYHNRFLYSRAWLMNSIQVPDLFEEDSNLVPTHSIGVMAHGTFDFFGDDSLNYTLSIANGRPDVPNSAIYARDYANDGKEISGVLEWTIPMFNDSRVGLSGWSDTIRSVRVDNFGDVVAADVAEETQFDEWGINPYVVVQGHGIHLLAEYMYSERTDTLGNLGGETWKMTGFTMEVSYRMMDGKMHPYLRWDQSDYSDGGDPYLNLREDGGEYTKVFLPEARQAMVGVAYDMNSHVRVKAEYLRNFAGAREKNVFTAQVAFGF